MGKCIKEIFEIDSTPTHIIPTIILVIENEKKNKENKGKAKLPLNSSRM